MNEKLRRLRSRLHCKKYNFDFQHHRSKFFFHTSKFLFHYSNFVEHFWKLQFNKSCQCLIQVSMNMYQNLFPIDFERCFHCFVSFWFSVKFDLNRHPTNVETSLLKGWIPLAASAHVCADSSLSWCAAGGGGLCLSSAEYFIGILQ